MIKLYELAAKDEAIRFSPYVWRVRLALLHKGIPFDGIPWHFTDKAAIASADSLAVPVIQTGGGWVKDSFDICLHLDEHYEGPKLIEDVTMAKFFNGWATRTVSLELFPMLAADIWSILTPEDQVYFRTTRERFLRRTLEEAQAGREEAIPAFLKHLAPIRDMLSKSKFLSGDAPGWSDYAMASIFIWARTVSDYDVLDDDMVLTEWLDRILDLFDGHVRKAPTAHDWS